MGKDAADKLRRFSEERNAIVHRGARPYIKRDKAEECIELVRRVAKAVDSRIVQRYDGHAPRLRTRASMT
jgi:hypothetical protein